MSGIPKTPSFRLDGRRALITGATRGIGFAGAVALAEAGARVMMVSRTAVAVEHAVTALQAAGLDAEGTTLDITDTDAVRELFQRNEPFDIVLNSAGIARHKPAFEVEARDYDLVMDVNARAAYFLACEAARRMKAAGGSIIQISSQMGHVGGIDRTVYCASKHAIEGMTKAMAIEWAPFQVRVNSICPTFIRTEFTEETLANPERRAWIESKIKLGRLGEVEDIMGAVVFLASDASALVTGTHILIDGGWTAG